MSLRSSVEFAFEVFKRDVRSQYRESLGGYFWAILPTIASVLVFLLAEQANQIKFQNTRMPYLVYVMIGMTLWQCFSDGLSVSLQTLDKNRGLLSKLRFPLYIVFCSKVIEFSANHLFRLLLISVVLLFIGKFNLLGLFAVTYLGFGLLLIGHVIGVILSPINLITQDISRAVPFVMNFLMWVTPVFLNSSDGTLLSKIMNLNPLTPFFNAAHNTYAAAELQVGLLYLWPLVVIPILICSYSLASTLLPIANERVQ